MKVKPTGSPECLTLSMSKRNYEWLPGSGLEAEEDADKKARSLGVPSGCLAVPFGSGKLDTLIEHPSGNAKRHLNV